MPLSSPSVVRTSRRLELLKVIRSGSRVAGLSSGCDWARACWRSAPIRGLRPLFLVPARRADALERRLRPALLDPVADDALELVGPRPGEAVRRCPLERLAVLEQRA